MNRQFYFWACVLILSLITSGLSMRWLALAGLPFYDSLLGRGGVCLILVVMYAQWTRQTLRPRSLKNQTVRAAIAGLALSFITMSYQWLTASAVAVLSNVDVPLLWVLGPLLGIPANRKTRVLSLVSIVFLGIYIANLEVQRSLFLGLGSLGLGCVLLCFGYLFIKKSMKDENQAITILVPTVAILVYGFVQHLMFVSPEVQVSKLELALQFVASGCSMFGAYYSTMKLYRLTDLVSAEFPTLLASILIQPVEGFFLDAPLQPFYFFSSAGFVTVIYVILRLQKREEEVRNATA